MANTLYYTSTCTCIDTTLATTTIYDTMRSQGAKHFLDSISRNSQRSKKTYAGGLTHFQRFLNSKYDNKYTLQSIIEPLSKNQINVYELLNDFVSYLLTVKNALSKNSIKLYLAQPDHIWLTMT